MLDQQYHRAILLLNNPIAALIALLNAQRWWSRNNAADGMASVLLISWLFNLVVLVFAVRQRRATRKQGYYQIFASVDDQNRAEAKKSQPTWAEYLLVVFADICFALTLIPLVVMTLLGSWSQNEGIAVASVGGVVAATVHSFYALLRCFRRTNRYRLKISLIRRDEEHSMLSAANRKEDRVSEESSVAEPETISPRPYRGSPSTKPSIQDNRAAYGPIKLTDPSEGDRLISDHD